jgi:glycosyltransferase 2 family protein
VIQYSIVINKMKPLIKVAKIIFTPLALCFLFYFGWQSKTTLINIFDNSQPLFLLIALSLWVLLHFISPLFTINTFQFCNVAIGYNEAFLIHASRLPAKYLPGGIWHSVARITDYHNKNISPRNVTAYLLLENIIIVCVTFLIGGLIITTMPQIDAVWLLIASLSSITGFIILLILPLLTNKFLINEQASLSKSSYGLGVVCVLFYWIIAATAFVLFLNSFSELSYQLSNIHIGGVYIFSWAIGFIALFAPQGVGVTEFVSSQLISTDIESAGFMALIASFRILILIGDLITWGIARLFYYLIKSQEH